jgi:cysteine desulfurase
MADPVIYLDHQATTPCDPAVLEAMAPWWSEQFANPSSRAHRPGLLAAAAVEQARTQIANGLGVPAESVLFTSGATEANNLALKGVAEAELEAGGGRRHLLCLATEHHAVLDPLRYLARHGFELTELPVQSDGLVDLEQLQAALRPDTLLVSVMAANNEIGVLQPLEAIARLCQARGIRFHCDAAQAIGHSELRPAALGIDLVSFSGHKLYGPKGIGALLVAPGVRLAPQLHGGGQERGLRAGTLPVPLIVGLARALELALADRDERAERLGMLRERLWQRLQALGGVQRNGAAAPRLAHNLNLRIEGVPGDQLLRALRPALALSSGSACSSGEPSHVLQALGLSRAQAMASLRISLGRHTSPEMIDMAADCLSDTILRLRGGWASGHQAQELLGRPLP